MFIPIGDCEESYRLKVMKKSSRLHSVFRDQWHVSGARFARIPRFGIRMDPGGIVDGENPPQAGSSRVLAIGTHGGS